MSKVDITMVLKGNKTWKDIFVEAEKAHPNNEQAQSQYAADLMKQIGFNIASVPVKVSGF